MFNSHIGLLFGTSYKSGKKLKFQIGVRSLSNTKQRTDLGTLVAPFSTQTSLEIDNKRHPQTIQIQYYFLFSEHFVNTNTEGNKGYTYPSPFLFKQQVNKTITFSVNMLNMLSLKKSKVIQARPQICTGV